MNPNNEKIIPMCCRHGTSYLEDCRSCAADDADALADLQFHATMNSCMLVAAFVCATALLCFILF